MQSHSIFVSYLKVYFDSTLNVVESSSITQSTQCMLIIKALRFFMWVTPKLVDHNPSEIS